MSSRRLVRIIHVFRERRLIPAGVVTFHGSCMELSMTLPGQ